MSYTISKSVCNQSGSVDGRGVSLLSTATGGEPWPLPLLCNFDSLAPWHTGILGILGTSMCAMVAPVRVIEAAVTNAVQCLGYAGMKPENLQVVSSIISGHDVFAVAVPVLHVKLPPAHVPSLCWVTITGD